ncbi:MAG: hypothetical protein FWC38_01330 [Proteobacteria bacterium]|nr:hypothetical protein [Pseudomonadota bacterium]
MENLQEARAVFSDSDQNEPSEYRFVFNRSGFGKRFRKAIVFYIVLLVLFFLNTVALFFLLFHNNEALRLLLLIFLLICLLQAPFLFYFPRLSMTFDKKGMACKGFWFNQMPRYCAWGEISQVTVSKIGDWQHRLVFMLHSGKRYILPISLLKAPFYVGDGHSLSIEEALKRFVGDRL